MSLKTANKKVYIVITRPVIGGAARHVRDISIALKDSFDITVISNNEDSDTWLYDECTSEGLKVIRSKWITHPISPFKDICFIFWFWFLCLTNKPHVVHAHSSKIGLYARIAARLALVKRVVFTAHGVSFQDRFHPIKRWVFLQAEKFAYFFCDYIICVSEFDHQKFLANMKDRGKKFVTIRNEVPPKEIVNKRPKDKIVIGSIGRLSFPKDNFTLLRAWKMLQSSELPLTHLIIKGDGDQKSDLESLSHELGISSTVTFEEGSPDPYDFYGRVHVVALSSQFEGLPYVLLEARASGCYLISSDVGGCSEVVSNARIGVLFEQGNSEELFLKMKELISTRNLRSETSYYPNFKEFISETMRCYS